MTYITDGLLVLPLGLGLEEDVRLPIVLLEDRVARADRLGELLAALERGPTYSVLDAFR